MPHLLLESQSQTGFPMIDFRLVTLSSSYSYSSSSYLSDRILEQFRWFVCVLVFGVALAASHREYVNKILSKEAVCGVEQ